jgi:hypothetical protein
MRFGEESLDEAISKRMLSHDCDGDGIADLVDVDLRGRVAIYRVLFESGFFSGDTWTLEKVPSRRFDVDASLRNLAVDDLNGDGLGDIFSHRDEHITLLLSRRRGDR